MTKWQEFARGWTVLMAASIGVATGIAGLHGYSAGLFVVDLSRDIGLTRTAYGLAFLLSSWAMALALPAVGWAVDRLGVKWTTSFGALGLSLCFAALGTLELTPTLYTIIMMSFGLLGAASGPVGYTRAVTAWFERMRGLALGITQAAVGVAGTAVPILVAWVIQSHGWRSGYLTLSFIAASAVPLVIIFLRVSPNQSEQDTSVQAMSFSEVIRRPLFWQQMATFMIMSFAIVGLLLHFVPILREAGLGAREAAGYAALLGLSVVASRLLVGFLADHVHVPWLAAGACAMAVTAALGLYTGTAALVPFAAIAIGCALGAEMDILSYLTSRYYDPAVYGRAYGWQYCGAAIASGLSPAWMGFFADRTGGYGAPLLVCAALLVVALGMFLMLPRYGRLAQPALTA